MVAIFNGIGNAFIGKFDKASGERVAAWTSPAGGPIVHLNGGHVEKGLLVLAHSNYPQLPMASSLEYFDSATLRPVKTFSLGIRPGSLTWAKKRRSLVGLFCQLQRTRRHAQSRSTLDLHWEVRRPLANDRVVAVSPAGCCHLAEPRIRIAGSSYPAGRRSDGSRSQKARRKSLEGGRDLRGPALLRSS